MNDLSEMCKKIGHLLHGDGDEIEGAAVDGAGRHKHDNFFIF